VITGIHQCCPIDLQAITKRKDGMIRISRRDSDIANCKTAFHKVVIADVGSALVKRNGEIHVLHLPCQSLMQRLTQSPRAVYVPFVPARKKRIKEWDTLDVIPMRVTDQNVPASALIVTRNQLPG